MLMKTTIAFERQERKDIVEGFRPLALLNLSPKHLEDASKKVIRVAEGNQVDLRMAQDAMSLTRDLEYRLKKENTPENVREFIGSTEPNKTLPENSIPLATNAETVVTTIIEARQMQLKRLYGARKHIVRAIAVLTSIDIIVSKAALLNKALGISEDEEIDEDSEE